MINGNTYLSGCVCFNIIKGSVFLSTDFAAPNSLNSINSKTTWKSIILHINFAEEEKWQVYKSTKHKRKQV